MAGWWAFWAPGSLDLLSVEFAAGEDADGFVPPAWFGPEVTQNPAYHRGSLARSGLPASEDIPLSNAMLEELLDVIEEGTIAAQLGRGSSLSIHDERPAGGSDGASRTERLAPSIVSAPADDLMAGLAEALKDVQPTRSAPASGLYVEHRWAHVDVRGPDVAESGTTQLDIAEYLNQGGQTAGHRELRRLLKALFKEQSGAPRS